MKIQTENVDDFLKDAPALRAEEPTAAEIAALVATAPASLDRRHARQRNRTVLGAIAAAAAAVAVGAFVALRRPVPPASDMDNALADDLGDAAAVLALRDAERVPMPEDEMVLWIFGSEVEPE